MQVPRNQLSELAVLLQREKKSLDALISSFQDAEPERLRDLLEKSLRDGEAVRRFAETGSRRHLEAVDSATKSFAIEAIETAIHESRSILELKNDWDGQDGVGYSPNTWEKAVDLLRRQALAGVEEGGRSIPAPRILPGPNGSIDLHWKTQAFELLINVQECDEECASFYGDDCGKLTIEGTIDTGTANDALLAWLMKARSDGPSRTTTSS